MLGRRAKTVVLAAALLVLVVEGVLLILYYDRYYGSEAASGSTAAGSAPASSGGTMPEGTILEGTAAALDGAPIGATDDAEDTDPGEPADKEASEEASFVHRATDANSRGDYTYLDHPKINGDPEAVVLVVAAPDRGSAGDGAYDHNTGVWYEPGARKWAIFNQDRAAVPAGTAFRVVVPREPKAFVWRSGSAPAGANGTYLDHPLLNGNPEAIVSVTQNWNPGGGAGVYNDHPVGLAYDAGRGRWLVYNTDGAPMKEGAAFNVVVTS